jgi:GT2 family glycosyltransferase
MTLKHNGLMFSVIVPTYARPVQLSACLRALAHLDYPRSGFEVIVVDDGGGTSLEAAITPVHDQLDITLLTQSHRGPAAARNAGAELAKGRFLAFTDDDCTPASGWLQALEAGFATAPDCAMGGRTLNALRDNPYSTASQMILEVVYAYYNTDPSRARFFASNNLAIPADSFRAIGGFDTTFRTSEDRELCDRWRYYGYRMMYVPEALVHHAHALTFRRFCKQHFHYGRGAFRFHQTRARRGSGSFRDELAFYAQAPSLLIRALSQVQARRVLSLTALLAVWQWTNAAGYVWERGKNHANCG